MSIRLYKAYTPGTRNRALSSFSEITKDKPEKSLVKKKEISEDDEKINEKIVQTFTDDHIKTIDIKVEAKEKEIMTI